MGQQDKKTSSSKIHVAEKVATGASSADELRPMVEILEDRNLSGKQSTGTVDTSAAKKSKAQLDACVGDESLETLYWLK